MRMVRSKPINADGLLGILLEVLLHCPASVLLLIIYGSSASRQGRLIIWPSRFGVVVSFWVAILGTHRNQSNSRVHKEKNGCLH